MGRACAFVAENDAAAVVNFSSIAVNGPSVQLAESMVRLR